ncbi:MAG: BMP family protein [Oscillospiraceae bacterium]
MKKVFALAVVFILCFSLFAACGSASSSQAASSVASESAATSAASEGVDVSSLKVAAIFGGSIADGNWNETQYNGLKAIEALGATIGYMENVGDADAAEAARTYASEGYNLIYLTTNSYQDYCSPVAKDFPETTFVQVNGTLIEDNFISVRIADEQQGFMQGVVAALLSQTGKVGFVGGLEINPIKLGSSGFQQGVDYVNATYGTSVEAQRINTGSFTDVNQAKETAISMIEAGCDVVAPMANDASVGVMEAAEEKGVMAIGAGLGQDASAPTATRTIVVKDVAIAYSATFEAFVAGELKATAEVETYGANRGVVYVTEWLGDVDADVQAKVAETMEKLAAGEITISLA